MLVRESADGSVSALHSGYVLVVGDIHGDLEAVRAALRFSGFKIFVGDLLDSFEYGVEAQMDCVDAVVEACEAGEALLICGNHEVSYLHEMHRCAGYNERTASLLQEGERLHRLKDVLVPYVVMNFTSTSSICVSHAGFTAQLLSRVNAASFDRSFEKAVYNAIQDPASWYYQVGKARGGLYSYGGPIWCDANEFVITPEHGRQIFGHTPQPGGGMRYYPDGSVCIDVLQRRYRGVVITGDGVIREYKFGESHYERCEVVS